MTRIANVLLRVRDTLNDQRAERWADSILYRLLQEGQEEIAKRSKLFKETSAITLIPGKHTYRLPSNAFELVSAVYDNDKLQIVSTKSFENVIVPQRVINSRFYTSQRYIISADVKWREQEGAYPIALIHNNLDVLNFRVFPIPTTEPVLFELNSVHGIITGIVAEDNPSLSTIVPEGAGTSIQDVEVIEVTYIRAPKSIIGTDQDLELPNIYNTALKHYVIGKALRNDTNEQNRNFGTEELSLYERELRLITTQADQDWISKDNFKTVYQGIG